MPKRHPDPLRGSVLLFSLIILSLLLISAISLATVAATDARSSLSVDRSNMAFQGADSGSEIMLQKIYSGDYDGCPSAPSGAACRLDTLPGSCRNGVLSGSIGQSTYEIRFYSNDSGNPQLGCNSTDWRNKTLYFTSRGIYGGTVRSIQVGIKPNHP